MKMGLGYPFPPTAIKDRSSRTQKLDQKPDEKRKALEQKVTLRKCENEENEKAFGANIAPNDEEMWQRDVELDHEEDAERLKILEDQIAGWNREQSDGWLHFTLAASSSSSHPHPRGMSPSRIPTMTAPPIAIAMTDDAIRVE